MLGSVPPKVAFALVLFVFCILVVWGYFTIASWFPKNWLFNTKKKKIISALTIVIFILAFPTTYSFINWFIQDVGSIVMDDYGDRSNVFVHYGERSIEKEVFSTNTTINKLESKPQFPLSVNGEHILTIHIKNDKVYFNARLFGGYKKQAFINLSLARTNDFLINLSGYLRTDILGATILQSPMGYITDNITVNKIADAILSPPILLEDKSTIPSELPKGWKKYRRATAIEIRNEYNIPVYIHEYKNPYEMTVSGIFYTSFGILKIDNSEDVTFQFGSNLGELGTYTVNNIFVHSFADLFISEKQYNLYKNYYNEGFINKAISFLEHLLAIPDKNIRNLVIKPTYFPATYSTPNGLLVEFSRRKDDIDPISVSVNVSGSRVDTQYAWWAKPNLYPPARLSKFCWTKLTIWTEPNHFRGLRIRATQK
ncbi:MAG: hypothetical protein PHG35_02015 [Dehalococcoidales bacterium]|nr:hypothetical protein [Dehalococcoidales bacterium]